MPTTSVIQELHTHAHYQKQTSIHPRRHRTRNKEDGTHRGEGKGWEEGLHSPAHCRTGTRPYHEHENDVTSVDRRRPKLQRDRGRERERETRGREGRGKIIKVQMDRRTKKWRIMSSPTTRVLKSIGVTQKFNKN